MVNNNARIVLREPMPHEASPKIWCIYTQYLYIYIYSYFFIIFYIYIYIHIWERSINCLDETHLNKTLITLYGGKLTGPAGPRNMNKRGNAPSEWKRARNRNLQDILERYERTSVAICR